MCTHMLHLRHILEYFYNGCQHYCERKPEDQDHNSLGWVIILVQQTVLKLRFAVGKVWDNFVVLALKLRQFSHNLFLSTFFTVATSMMAKHLAVGGKPPFILARRPFPTDSERNQRWLDLISQRSQLKPPVNSFCLNLIGQGPVSVDKILWRHSPLEEGWRQWDSEVNRLLNYNDQSQTFKISWLGLQY